MPVEKQKKLSEDKFWGTTEDIWLDQLGWDVGYLRIKLSYLKTLIKESNSDPDTYKKYSEVFYVTIDMLYNGICIEIVRLCDNRKDVMSVRRMLGKSISSNNEFKKEYAKSLDLLKEKSEKIEGYRHNFLVHKNEEKNLDLSRMSREEHVKFFNEIKPKISEFEDCLDVIDKAILLIASNYNLDQLNLVPSRIEEQTKYLFNRLRQEK